MLPEWNRRKEERFCLRLFSSLSYLNDEQENQLNLYTSDISSRGAFFETNETLPTGTTVSMELLLIPPKDMLNKYKRGCVKVSGEVVRSTEEGMAVFFYDDYKLTPMSLI